MTAAAADAYPRVERALSDESLLHAVLAALGPVADAVAATPMETLSVGIQLGFEPEGIGLYGFAGAASPI